MKPDLKGIPHHPKAGVQSFSMGGEMRDFTGAFTKGVQLQQGMSRSKYYNALADQAVANAGNKVPTPEAAAKGFVPNPITSED